MMDQERFKSIVERIKEKNSNKSRKDNLVEPLIKPRYDDVFFEGLSWLDSLAYTDNWNNNSMDIKKVLEPCVSQCHLLNTKSGRCELYNTVLDSGNIEDPYDDGYKFTHFKCEECMNRELDANLSLVIEELEMIYDSFVVEFDHIINKLRKIKGKLNLITTNKEKK